MMSRDASLALAGQCATLGRIHLPCLPRPLADDPQARAQYDAKALLASMNSTRTYTGKASPSPA
jgi:hypothetical protein